MQPTKPKQHETTLALAFHFTRDDLEANRQGMLSTRQRGSLRVKLAEQIAKFAPTLVLALFILSLSVLVIFSAGVSTLTKLILNLPIWLILGGIMFLGIGRSLYQFWRDHQTRRVASVEGVVGLDVSQTMNPIYFSRAKHYSAMIGDVWFAISKDQLLALKNGDPYRVYFAAHSRTILSVEWLNANPFEV